MASPSTVEAWLKVITFFTGLGIVVTMTVYWILTGQMSEILLATGTSLMGLNAFIKVKESNDG